MKFRMNYLWPCLLVVLAGVFAVAPAMFLGIPAGHDLPSHLRFAMPFYDAIHAGTLHPGWLAEANGGFGDAGLRVYPPALYYLLAATRGLTGSWYNGLLLGFTLLSVLGAVGVYFWARCFLPRNHAIVAGVLYAFVPYRINEIYGASLLAEYAAGSVLPFVFAFIQRVCRGRRLSDVAGLAISVALLVLSNLPLAVIGSLAALFYALLSIEKGTYRRGLASLALGAMWGAAASAFYLTTMLSEISWIRNAPIVPSDELTSYFDYRKNFVFSAFSLPNANSRLAGTLTLATLSMALAALIMFCSPYRKKLRHKLKVVFALLGFSLLMTTDLSRPIWFVIPKLKEVQFPWRWLAIASAPVPLLTAASIPFWKEQLRGKFRWAAIVALGCVLVSLTYSAARMRDANYLPRFEFESSSSHVFSENSLDYWLPVWVNARPPATSGRVEVQSRTVEISSWEPEKRSFSIGPGPAQEIRVQTFYYPHWVARTSEGTLPTQPAYDGALVLSVPAAATSVQLEFQEPRRTRIAMIVTAFAWGLAVLVLTHGVLQERRSGHEQVA